MNFNTTTHTNNRMSSTQLIQVEAGPREAEMLKWTSEAIAKAIAHRATFPVSATILEGWTSNAILELLEDRITRTPAELGAAARELVIERLRRPLIVEAFKAIADLANQLGGDQAGFSDLTLRRLAPSSRRAIMLTILEGLDDREAAELAMVTKAEYRRQLAEAVAQLRKLADG